MVYLLVLPLLFALFNVLLRHLQRLGLPMLPVGAATYVVCAVCYGLMWALHPTALNPATLKLGLWAGSLFFLLYLLLVSTMSDRGVSLASALIQLSVLIPLLASLTIWHERPTLLKALGAGLCLVAMPLLALDKGTGAERPSWGRMLVYLGLLVVNGVALTAAKFFAELGTPEQLPAYMTILMGLCALCLTVTAAARRSLPNVAALRWSLLSGAVLWGGQTCILLALQHLPGTVVYPVSQAAMLALVLLLSALLWREVPGPLGRAGIGVALVAVILVNL